MFRFWIRFLMVMALSCVAHRTTATTLDIAANFSSHANGARQGFIDTTRRSAACAGIACHLLVTSLTVTAPAAPTAALSDSNQRVFRLGAPGAPRKMTVSNGTETHPLELRIATIALTQRGAGAPWVFIDNQDTHGGCRAVGDGRPGSTDVAWALPKADTHCEARATNLTQPARFDVALGYELVFPDAIRMANGVYRGEVRYGVGKGGHIDTYDGEATDAELVVRVTLTVEHEFRIDFGQGAGNPVMRVDLEPPGGWGNTGTNIVGKSVPFRVSAGGPFSVTILCGVKSTGGCALASTRAGTRPRTLYVDDIDIGGESHTSPDPSFPMSFNASAKVLVQAPSSLKFSSQAGEVGERYEGGITLVFEAK
jgi:hypothetical protein